MKDEKSKITAVAIEKMIDFYQGNLRDIEHFLKVWAYAKTIGEQEGVEYHFTDEAGLARLQKEDRVIEIRAYDTVYGVWKYFTVWEEQMNLERESYCLIGTLEAWNAMCQYFGREKMIPVYIEVEDGTRLIRAVERERTQEHPGYEELCRRFLADAKDFSEENLKNAGITRRFENKDMNACLDEIKLFIQKAILI